MGNKRTNIFTNLNLNGDTNIVPDLTNNPNARSGWAKDARNGSTGISQRFSGTSTATTATTVGSIAYDGTGAIRTSPNVNQAANSTILTSISGNTLSVVQNYTVRLSGSTTGTTTGRTAGVIAVGIGTNGDINMTMKTDGNSAGCAALNSCLGGCDSLPTIEEQLDCIDICQSVYYCEGVGGNNAIAISANTATGTTGHTKFVFGNINNISHTIHNDSYSSRIGHQYRTGPNVTGELRYEGNFSAESFVMSPNSTTDPNVRSGWAKSSINGETGIIQMFSATSTATTATTVGAVSHGFDGSLKFQPDANVNASTTVATTKDNSKTSIIQFYDSLLSGGTTGSTSGNTNGYLTSYVSTLEGVNTFSIGGSGNARQRTLTHFDAAEEIICQDYVWVDASEPIFGFSTPGHWVKSGDPYNCSKSHTLRIGMVSDNNNPGRGRYTFGDGTGQSIITDQGLSVVNTYLVGTGTTSGDTGTTSGRFSYQGKYGTESFNLTPDFDNNPNVRFGWAKDSRNGNNGTKQTFSATSTATTATTVGTMSFGLYGNGTDGIFSFAKSGQTDTGVNVGVSGNTNNPFIQLINNNSGATIMFSGGSLIISTPNNPNGFVISQEVFVTGGTYNNPTGTATFTNNTGGTFTVTGFTTGGSSSNKYTLTTGFTANIALTIPHNLGSSDVIVQTINTLTNEKIELKTTNYTTNSIKLTSSETLPSVRVIIIS